MKDDGAREFEALLDAYFDDSADPTVRERLDAELRRSGEARARFWERADLEESLAAWGRRRRGEVTALAEVRSPDPAPGRKRWAVFAGWAAAALLLAALLFRPSPLAPDERGGPSVAGAGEAGSAASTDARSGNPVAYLSQLVGAKTAVPYLAGQTLAAGEEVTLEEGLMEVVFYSGARITVRGPARFRPESDLEIAVFEGGVQADVPESAVGFRMELPDGLITDFGTSFDVSVSDGRASRVQVLEGEVEFAGRDADPERLTTGEAVALGEAGELEAIDFEPMAVGRALREGAARSAAERMAGWREFCGRIDRDPALVAHFSMLPEELGASVIRNQSRSHKVPGSGTVISAGWSEGRWPGKPALAFRRPADRVRIDIPGEFPRATFVAWVRVDGLPRDYNGLFYSEYGIEGEAHWQFDADGSYFFGVRPKGTSEPVRFHRAPSDPVISPWEFGSWRMLATTYDSESREVVHYVDRAEVARVAIGDSIPLRFGRATLGNFFDPLAEQHAGFEGLGTNWSFRNWTGVIDEFALFSRVLTPAELRQFHDAGRVD